MDFGRTFCILPYGTRDEGTQLLINASMRYVCTDKGVASAGVAPVLLLHWTGRTHS